MEMTSEKLTKLIEKYFDAETTLEEESELKRYFSQAEILPEFEQYRPVFNYWQSQIEEEKAISKNGLLDAIQPKKSYRFEIWAAAAVVILLITSLWIWAPQKDLSESPQNLYADTYDDPEVALQEAKKLLSMVSNKMNRGAEAIVELEKFNETQQKLKK